MKSTFVSGLILLYLAGTVQATDPAGKSRDILYQAATINALLGGAYNGFLACGELTRHGDFGLGTFDALDGEMIVLDGVVYQVGHDGRVNIMSPTNTTPFANVTFFDHDEVFDLRGIENLAQLERTIDRRLTNRNIFYAILVDGLFDSVKVRSVPRQTKPYPRLTDAVKNQSVFELKNVKGMLVGFWCPALARELNVPGFHLHFLSADRKSGGHLLDCRLKIGRASLDLTPILTLHLPESGMERLDLSGHRAGELNGVEK